MSAEEKNTWVFGTAAILGYLAYLIMLLTSASGIALSQKPYIAPMLICTGGAIAVGIIAGIVIGLRSGGGGKKDQRDREIYRFGEYIGQSFVVVGGVSALVLAMVQAPYFWIANAVYLSFVLSAVLSTISRLIAYRRGFQQW